MANHILGYEDWNKLPAVVNAEGEPNKLRQDRGPTGPNLDDIFPTRCPRMLRLFQQIAVNKRAFPN
jgi:hypothetical protein